MNDHKNPPGTVKNQPWTMKNQPGNLKNQPGTLKNQTKPLKTYQNRHGTMKNQSELWKTMKTNLELYRVVTGGYRRLQGGSDHFSWQTDTQTLHHNIYIIIITWIGGGSQRIAAQASPDHRTLEEGQLWSEPPWFDRSDDKTWQWQPGFVSFSLSCPWTLWLRPLSPLGGQPKTDRDEVYKSFVPSKISTMVKGAGYFHSAGQSREG